MDWDPELKCQSPLNSVTLKARNAAEILPMIPSVIAIFVLSTFIVACFSYVRYMMLRCRISEYTRKIP